MSKIEIKPFEEQIRIAAIAGELERAEQRGHENGLKEGHENGRKEIILELLEKYTPQEVSNMTKIPIKKIIKIRNDG